MYLFRFFYNLMNALVTQSPRPTGGLASGDSAEVDLTESGASVSHSFVIR